MNTIVIANDIDLNKVPLVAILSKYDSVTVMNVINIEENLITDKVTYLSDVNGQHVLGESVPLSATLIEKMKQNIISDANNINNTITNILEQFDIMANTVILTSNKEINVYVDAHNVNRIIIAPKKRGWISRFLYKNITDKIERDMPNKIIKI